jgi:hypothetical protein
MELHEEYWSRRKLKAPLIKYVDRGNLILKARGKAEYGWLHVHISSNNDGQHPVKYGFTVSANPTLYSTPDMGQVAHHSKIIKELTWEWEQYESGLLDWVKENAKKYEAIPSQDAALVSWEMFLVNYDLWLANFLPYRMLEEVYRSLNGSRDERMAAVKATEDYIKERYDRVFACWKNIRGAIEQKNYADWLCKVVNDAAA